MFLNTDFVVFEFALKLFKFFAMETFYIILIGMLLVLSVIDLLVGVSNDAVNFLNSAVGSKAFNIKFLMFLAAVGVFVGATFSNGMMDIARHGIFQPEHYTFAELVNVFVAVMLTDVVLLNIFNSLGMPTSTTVSMVFGLLGASTSVAIIKLNQSIGLSYGDLVNTSKALSVILGIFLSVAIAFTVGVFVQYITRLIFTFGYKKNLKYFIGIFGGISLSSICYFILVKGLKNMAFMNDNFKAFISENEISILLLMLAFFFLVSHLLHAVGVNMLKVIIAFGTFSLALAFAGNDLVNFVGVPLTGLSSLQHLIADRGFAETYTMEALRQSEPGQWYLLMIAGIVMVCALVFSKNSWKVIQTSVSLSSQNSSEEIFGTNPIARALVRFTRTSIAVVSSVVPSKISASAEKRFDKSQITLEHDAAFDLLRAAVNLMLASSLIAFGTSLKLPLSTTYVTFMVAMGTSLADRAWSRETAVYRITGVLSVIGGWFATAFAAFSASFVIAAVSYFGGFPAKFVMFALVILIIIRSFFKKETKEVAEQEERFSKILNAGPDTKVLPLVQEYSRSEWAEILKWSGECYKDIVQGFLREDLGKLRTVGKQIKILKKHSDRMRRHSPICSEKLAQEDMIPKNFFLYQTNDFVVDTLSSLQQIEVPCKQHVDNGFIGLASNKRKMLLRISRDVEKLIEESSNMFKHSDFSKYENIRNNIIESCSRIHKERKLEMQKTETENIRVEIVYLTILYETWALLNSVSSLNKAGRKFLGFKYNIPKNIA